MNAIVKAVLNFLKGIAIKLASAIICVPSFVRANRHRMVCLLSHR